MINFEIFEKTEAKIRNYNKKHIKKGARLKIFVKGRLKICSNKCDRCDKLCEILMNGDIINFEIFEIIEAKI